MFKSKTLKSVIDYAIENQVPIEKLEIQINKLKDLATKLPLMFNKNDCDNVDMQYWKTPADFYVAKMDYECELESLQSVVQKSAMPEKVFIPNKGIICAARIKDIWYRVQLETVKSNKTCRVRLLDYGSSAIVEFQHLFLLEPCLFRISPLVAKCQMKTELNVSEKFRRHFVQICQKATAFRIVVNDIKENVYSVELFAMIDGQMENVEMLLMSNENMEMSMTNTSAIDVIMEEDGTMSVVDSNNISVDIADSSFESGNMIASSPKQLCELNEGSQLVISEHNVSNAECSPADTHCSPQEVSGIQKLSSRIDAKLTYFVSPNEFYICLHKYDAALQLLHRNVQQICYEITSEDVIEEHTWTEQDLCFLQAPVMEWNKKTTYLKWYRGRIMQIGDHHLDVFLIDVGATVQIHPDCVYFSDDALLHNVKSGVIQCQMACIRPNSADFWDDRYMDRIKMGIEQYEGLSVSIQANKIEKALPVILWGCVSPEQTALAPTIKTWTNINEQLIQIEVAELSNVFIDIDQNKTNDFDMSYLDLSIDDITLNGNADTNGNEETNISYFEITEPILYNVTNDVYKVEQWLPSVPIGKSVFVGTPTYVDSKCRIYLLDNYRKFLAEKMALVIQERIEEMPEEEPEVKWCKGAPCLARYKDGRFYRAEVRRVKDERQICNVRFVDYGNVETIKLTNLRVADILGNVPILTRRYSLGVKPYNQNGDQGRWPEKALEYVELRLVDVLCDVRVRDFDTRSEIDAEVDIKGAGVTDIRTYLLEEKLAKIA